MASYTIFKEDDDLYFRQNIQNFDDDRFKDKLINTEGGCFYSPKFGIRLLRKGEYMVSQSKFSEDAPWGKKAFATKRVTN